MEHTTAFVHCAQKILIEFIKKNFPLVKKINYVSDGASAHFKNNASVLNPIHHNRDFGLDASWTFTATGHDNPPVNIFYLDSDEVEKVKKTYKTRTEKLRATGTIQGIHSMHEFKPTDHSTVQYSFTSGPIYATDLYRISYHLRNSRHTKFPDFEAWKSGKDPLHECPYSAISQFPGWKLSYTDCAKTYEVH
ncbi:unnamed protein product [Adineta ricciae]|uniref:Uncharacterized protein n=1 Tax=Adineta ricciae TaxID=249248 RepID=A0A816C9D9_ADIRI|nr:unnamed protein product [Adineta ricciae]